MTQRLRQLREQRNLTAKALSLRAGLPWSYVARVECGEIRDPRVSTCQKLAEALGVSVAELIGEGRAKAREEARNRRSGLRVKLPIQEKRKET